MATNTGAALTGNYYSLLQEEQRRQAQKQISTGRNTDIEAMYGTNAALAGARYGATAENYRTELAQSNADRNYAAQEKANKVAAYGQIGQAAMVAPWLGVSTYAKGVEAGLWGAKGAGVTAAGVTGSGVTSVGGASASSNVAAYAAEGGSEIGAAGGGTSALPSTAGSYAGAAAVGYASYSASHAIMGDNDPLNYAAAGAAAGAVIGNLPGAAIGGAIGFAYGVARGCIIVTACTDSNSPEVEITRRYRDKFLDRDQLRGYYRIAELIVPKIENSAYWKRMVKIKLVDRLVDYGSCRLGYTKKCKISSFVVSKLFLATIKIVGISTTVYVRQNGEVY
jgi:hypothetical protein